ncbi:MAG: extracellular solute-binding protein [Candidatus Cohnella colombiensis]|uniref:Extracellular solute-binding protein n=1 Tax=Candidatus Cohnella colombiensis TaxID=3121368 RepID=A0AA95JAT0_9BACL|nr:MAG: extracellular solute-binding protein [Cohnella sp.]
MLKRLRRYIKPALWTTVVVTILAWWIYGTDSTMVHANLINNLDELHTYSESSYQNYKNKHEDTTRPTKTIRIEGEAFTSSDNCECTVLKDYEGATGEALRTSDTGSVTWKFNVPEEGAYTLKLRYFTEPGKSAAIERSLLVDGALPFDEASSVTFDRVWTNEVDTFKRDNRDNEIRPSQVEVPTWLERSFKDSQGLYADPFLFFFTKGEHTITLEGKREPIVIDYLELYQEQELPTYAEVKLQYEANGYQSPTNVSVKVQAEHAVRKSSPTLYPVSDHSSPATEPYSVSKIRLNTIGGNNWRMPSQWIEWEIEVPQDGLYQLGLKIRQDQLRGLFSNRKLSIDGVIPFKEMESLTFNYSSSWKMFVPGGDDPYQFYLTKGKHTIKLEADLGEVSSLVRTVQSSMLEINRIYRKILVITSADPDPFRDYQLGKRIPEMASVFSQQSDVLYSVAEKLYELTGEKSDKTAILYMLAKELKEFSEDTDIIPRNLKQFKTDVGSLGTWLLTVREMPLQLDYLMITSPDVQLPAASASTLESFGHTVSSFGHSFIEDYNSIGNLAEGSKKVTVWIGTGRDQAQVVKQLIDDTFTPEMLIGVDLKLVDMSILLSATLAGQGPDVAMMIGNGDPVNYAMRSASYDLSQFPDFKQVADRFTESAMVPYQFNGGVYGLSEQQIFDVLFYRIDILEELGLKVPQTWDDVYKMIPDLKKNNMEFGLPILNTKIQQSPALPINEAFAMLLYQHGGSFYKEDSSGSNLDTEIGMSTFQQWTDFYTAYKFPVDYDFVNRFRLGEVPIGIDPYTTYNTLSVFAPEIRGQWAFTLVPGTLKEDGSIDRSIAFNGTSVMMLDSAKDKDSAWEFMKWWTSKETQVQYGREMESLMGESARYPTSNVEALAELPWPVSDFKTLSEQRTWVKGIPEIPGGYFTGRILDNAFRRVINSSENARDALYDQVLYMNNEIAIKRDEFGLSKKARGSSQ